MRIFVDINHPGHIHYFKNFIHIMQSRGHAFFITTRDKEVSLKLLDSLELPYYDRGKGSKGLAGKILYMLKADYILYKKAREFKPDLFFSFGTMYAAHASMLMRKHNIAFDDTEHARFQQLLTNPFSNIVLTPSCYTKNFGKKQIRFASYMELAALHHRYYTPNQDIYDLLGIKQGEKFILFRFVSWNASHDVGHSGLTLKDKLLIVKELSKSARVFISSEGEIPTELRSYQINIPPHKMHDALAYATLFVGEGATMASECAMLGTPAIYVNSLSAGTLEEQEGYGLISGYRNSDGVLQKAKELLQMTDLKEEYQSRRKKMLEDKIDLTAFMVWFVENYPKSKKIMKENPSYQYNFK